MIIYKASSEKLILRHSSTHVNILLWTKAITNVHVCCNNISEHKTLIEHHIMSGFYGFSSTSRCTWLHCSGDMYSMLLCLRFSVLERRASALSVCWSECVEVPVHPLLLCDATLFHFSRSYFQPLVKVHPSLKSGLHLVSASLTTRKSKLTLRHLECSLGTVEIGPFLVIFAVRHEKKQLSRFSYLSRLTWRESAVWQIVVCCANCIFPPIYIFLYSLTFTENMLH